MVVLQTETVFRMSVRNKFQAGCQRSLWIKLRKVRHGLSTGDSPGHAGLLQALGDKRYAGSFDHTACNGQILVAGRFIIANHLVTEPPSFADALDLG